MKNKEELKRVWVVWSTSGHNSSLAGIFTDKEKAKRACKVGDCLHYMDLNYYEKYDIDTTSIARYKAEDGSFLSFNDINNSNTSFM